MQLEVYNFRAAQQALLIKAWREDISDLMWSIWTLLERFSSAVISQKQSVENRKTVGINKTLFIKIDGRQGTIYS